MGELQNKIKEKIQNKIPINKKNKITLISIALILIILILIIGFYIGNEQFRTFFNRYILRKEIIENNVSSIDITSLENPSVYAYDRYITILSKNKLETYSSYGKKEYEQEISISDALYASNNRFLVVAQKNGQNIYLISEANIMWQTEIEGQIQKIDVNKNGYVTIVITGSSYKTIIATYSPAGKELFKTYLSSTTSIDTSMSNDNKYLGIAEINTSGTRVQSSIKIISVEKAQNDPTNSVIYTKSEEADKLITNIEYQDKNKLLVQYDDSISILNNETETKMIDFKENKVNFASIELSNYMMYTIEKKLGLFNTSTQIVLKNISTDKENIYTASSAIKDIKTKSGNIAINLGSSIDFINTSGWLIKRYISQKEIKDILVGQSIAAIVYKDKVEIANI